MEVAELKGRVTELEKEVALQSEGRRADAAVATLRQAEMYDQCMGPSFNLFEGVMLQAHVDIVNEQSEHC